MAKVKIQGHASGTGILTVTAPNTSTDRTITLPDATATLSTFDPDGAVTINDTGADVDFRVESDTDANALFVQGSDSKVGINTATPNAVLHIGDSSAEGSQTNPALQIGRSGGSADSYRLGFYTTSEGGHIENKNGDDGLNFKVKTSGQVLQLTTDGRGLSQFTAKAWIYATDVSGTPTIQDSHNISSITDAGTGSFQITFSNALGSSNYAWSQSVKKATTASGIHLIERHDSPVRNTGALAIYAHSTTDGTLYDPQGWSVIFFGD
jgi:hypothetical protein